MTTAKDLLKKMNKNNPNEEANSTAEELKDIYKKSQEKKMYDNTQGHPKNSIELDTSTGTAEGNLVVDAETAKRNRNKDRKEAVADFISEQLGYDPDVYWLEDDGWRESRWQIPPAGEWLTSYKFKITLKPEYALDIDHLRDKIWSSDENFEETMYGGKSSRVIFVSDTHIGKSEIDGGGTKTIISRWKKSILQSIGDHHYEEITLVFGGDLIEGYSSQGGKNIPACDIPLADQLTAAQDMVIWTISQATKHANQVKVIAVAGNHGDITRYVNTSTLDSYDLSIVKSAQRAFELFGQVDKLEFFYPEDGEMSLVVDTLGGTLAIGHGHKFGTSGAQLKKAQDWWEKRSFGGYPEARAQVLLAGHFHNFQMSNVSHEKWVIFSPSLETRSQWLANLKGTSAISGMVAFDFVSGMPMGINIY